MNARKNAGHSVPGDDVLCVLLEMHAASHEARQARRNRSGAERGNRPYRLLPYDC